MKRIIICLVTIIFIFTGCDSKKDDRPLKDENGIINFTALTTYTIGGTAWGEDPISRAITEKTGIALELEYADSGDFNEKLSLLLASGDYPELLMSVDNYQLADLINAQALYSFDDYLSGGKGENIKSVFGDKLGAMATELDDKTYGFNKDFGRIPENTSTYIQIQYTVLKEFGYPPVETLDDVGELIEKYIEKYKTYGDLPLIGLISPASSSSIQHGISNALLRTAGFQDDGNFYIDPETYEASFGLMMDEAKSYMKWLNKMYLKDLFSLDSFTLDHNKMETEILKGNILCVTSPEWAINGAESKLRTINNAPQLAYAKIPIYIDEKARKNSRVSNYDSLGTWKSVITQNCRAPEVAMDFFNTMWSEEMQILVNWGVEGDLYTVDDNGQRQLSNDAIARNRNDANFRLETGITLYNYWSSGALVKDSTGQYINPFFTPEIMSESYTDEDREVIRAYGGEEATVWTDLWPKPELSPWGFAWKISLPRGEGKKAETKIREEIAPKYMYKMVAEAPTEEDFNALWDEYIDACNKTAIDIREQEVTAAIKKRMNQWYGMDLK